MKFVAGWVIVVVLLLVGVSQVDKCSEKSHNPPRFPEELREAPDQELVRITDRIGGMSSSIVGVLNFGCYATTEEHAEINLHLDDALERMRGMIDRLDGKGWAAWATPKNMTELEHIDRQLHAVWELQTMYCPL